MDDLFYLKEKGFVSFLHFEDDTDPWLIDDIKLTADGLDYVFEINKEKNDNSLPIHTNSGIEKNIELFRSDYPEKQKTAFIMMEFGESEEHTLILNIINDTLIKYNITGLRADDKEYHERFYIFIYTSLVRRYTFIFKTSVQ